MFQPRFSHFFVGSEPVRVSLIGENSRDSEGIVT